MSETVLALSFSISIIQYSATIVTRMLLVNVPPNETYATTENMFNKLRMYTFFVNHNRVLQASTHE